MKNNTTNAPLSTTQPDSRQQRRWHIYPVHDMPNHLDRPSTRSDNAINHRHRGYNATCPPPSASLVFASDPCSSPTPSTTWSIGPPFIINLLHTHRETFDERFLKSIHTRICWTKQQQKLRKKWVRNKNKHHAQQSATKRGGVKSSSFVSNSGINSRAIPKKQQQIKWKMKRQKLSNVATNYYTWTATHHEYHSCL